MSPLLNQLWCLVLTFLLLAGLFRLLGVNLFKFQLIKKLGLAAAALFLAASVLPGILQGLSSVAPGSFLLGWFILSAPAYYLRRSMQPHKAPAREALSGIERTPLPAQHLHSLGERDE